jgi:hypothetical protein
MALHGYCIRRAGEPAPPPGTSGVDGAGVRLLEAGGVGIWLSEAPSDGSPDAARLREHDRVVRAAMATGTPLPVRYGARFGNSAEVEAGLAARAADFLELLHRVDGMVEMGVRVLWSPETEAHEPAGAAAGRGSAAGEMVPSTPGTAYLEKRRERLEGERALRDRAERLLQPVEAALAAVARGEAVRELLPAAEIAGTLAHLIPRGEVARYRSAVERVGAGLDLDLVTTGPWAPYSFVSAGPV